MSKSTIKVTYPHTSFDREVETKPSGQKFGVGEEVYIRPIFESHKSHFSCDLITKVEYGYNQAHGDGSASDRYSTEVAAWYDECQLMPTNGMNIKECRAACADYFGESYKEMMSKRTGIKEKISTSINVLIGNPSKENEKWIKSAISNGINDAINELKDEYL